MAVFFNFNKNNNSEWKELVPNLWQAFPGEGSFPIQFGFQARLFPSTQPCLGSWTAQEFACFTFQMLAKVKNTAGKKSVKQSNDPTAEHMGHTGLAWEPLLSWETVGFICTSLLDLTLCYWSSIKKGVTSLGLTGKKWWVLSNFKGCEWGRACDLLKLFNPLSF